MPLDPTVLGFSNRWYGGAMQHAREFLLKRDLRIRVVTAPYFLATKFEAFHGRGGGDVLTSHDLEDIISVIDGRQEILSEVFGAEPEVRQFLGEQIEHLIADRVFANALEGFLPGDRASQDRAPLLQERLQSLAQARRQ